MNDLLDGHVLLDGQCLDRIYLNGYAPNLHVGGHLADTSRFSHVALCGGAAHNPRMDTSTSLSSAVASDGRPPRSVWELAAGAASLWLISASRSMSCEGCTASEHRGWWFAAWNRLLSPTPRREGSMRRPSSAIPLAP